MYVVILASACSDLPYQSICLHRLLAGGKPNATRVSPSHAAWPKRSYPTGSAACERGANPIERHTCRQQECDILSVFGVSTAGSVIMGTGIIGAGCLQEQ